MPRSRYGMIEPMRTDSRSPISCSAQYTAPATSAITKTASPKLRFLVAAVPGCGYESSGMAWASEVMVGGTYDAARCICRYDDNCVTDMPLSFGALHQCRLCGLPHIHSCPDVRRSNVPAP